jgi:hypothetical protein
MGIAMPTDNQIGVTMLRKVHPSFQSSWNPIHQDKSEFQHLKSDFNSPLNHHQVLLNPIESRPHDGASRGGAICISFAPRAVGESSMHFPAFPAMCKVSPKKLIEHILETWKYEV